MTFSPTPAGAPQASRHPYKVKQPAAHQLVAEQPNCCGRVQPDSVHRKVDDCTAQPVRLRRINAYASWLVPRCRSRCTCVVLATPRLALGDCRAWGRARVDPEIVRSLCESPRNAGWLRADLQGRINPISGSTRRAREDFGTSRRWRLVVWPSHTSRRRLEWRQISPWHGPDPKPDSLLAGSLAPA